MSKWEWAGDWCLVDKDPEGRMYYADGEGNPYFEKYMDLALYDIEKGEVVLGLKVDHFNVEGFGPAITPENRALIAVAPGAVDVCKAIVMLNKVGQWPKDTAMQGLAESARQVVKEAGIE
jgi:hypothetical protein